MPKESTRPKRKFFHITKVEGRCRNTSIGQLFDQFIIGRATPEEDEKFRDHLLECLYCSALVGNVKRTREASEYYGIPPGPKLDPYLTEITLRPLPEKLIREQKAMWRRRIPIKRKGEQPH
jgi:hypothetical protein